MTAATNPHSREPRERRALLPMVIALALAVSPLPGCAVGPDFVSPEAPQDAGYSAGGGPRVTASAPVAGGAAQRLALGRDIPGEWWRLFRSKQISALVEEAIENHPDIVAAEAALRRAREIAEADAASYLPQGSISMGATRQQISTAAFGGFSTSPLVSSAPTEALQFSLFNTNVGVSFTPDVFGKTARTVESDLAVAEQQRFQLEATYLTLTANVVSAAIADASYASQIKVTRDLIAAYQAQLDLLQKRFELGAIALSDVVSERALLAQAQATLPPLEKARAQMRDQLMAYLGRFPSADKGEAVDLEGLHLPKELPLSLPSNLVRQRPDIRAAESQLHQATANVGVATANMFPPLTLSASGGSQAPSLNQLIAPQTTIYNLGASVAAQSFDGGALFHKREANVAALEQATAQYSSTVINAFRNVADALQAVKHDADTLRAEVAAEKAAAESLTIVQNQYTGGSTTYATVLNAEQTLLNARINRVKAQAARFSDTTALLQALGGGWWNRVDETPASLPRPTDLIATSPVAAGVRAVMEDAEHAR